MYHVSFFSFFLFLNIIINLSFIYCYSIVYFLLYVFVHVLLVPCLYQTCADGPGVSVNNDDDDDDEDSEDKEYGLAMDDTECRSLVHR